ncbi:hypothetical protein HH303_17460 [Rhodospirillaceae bacterium KN72]|uniref:Uncharacterized protein n=1 Tax=Pacificispira spongiicola TaxID=2729598 RepID=A0A7Y0HHV3_9PROT|nr:hypothetical protein [Pacificispira spongiicola]NMM46282.1 hypothetical protein [Pacificispira spongiicola]
MSEYGFLGFGYTERQTHGFFVDSGNRILYWPSKEAPGYHLPFSVAAQIASPRRSVWKGNRPLPFGSSYMFGVVIAIVIVAAIALFALFSDPTRNFMDLVFHGLHDRYPDFFSETGSFAAVFAGVLVGAFPIALVFRFYNRVIVRKVREELDHTPGVRRIDEVRPPVVKLRPSELATATPASGWTRIKFYSLSLLMLLGGVIATFVVLTKSDILTGDYIAGLISGVALIYFGAVWCIALVRRPSVKDLLVYAPSQADIEAISDTTPSSGERPAVYVPQPRTPKFGALFKNIWVSWGVPIIGGLAAVAFMLILRYDPQGRYDAEAVLDSFCHTVLWGNLDAAPTACSDVPANAVLIRWESQPTIVIDNKDDGLKGFEKNLRGFVGDQFASIDLPKPAFISTTGTPSPFLKYTIRRPTPDEPLSGNLAEWRYSTRGAALAQLDIQVNLFEARTSERMMGEMRLSHLAYGTDASLMNGDQSYLLNGDVVRTETLIPLVLYDKRLHAGMAAAQVIATARTIFQEIGMSDSVEKWRDARRKNQSP